MKFLHDKRQAGVLAVLAAVIGAAGLFLGAGAAQAGYPCNDEPAPKDTRVGINNDTFVGIDTHGSPGFAFAYACVAPTGGEANQQWVLVIAGDPSNPAPGYTAEAGGCTGLPGDPLPPGCTYLVKPTGAEVSPATSANAPASGAAGTGGSVGVGTGTCVYVDGAPTCPLGFTIGGLTVHESDASLPTVHPNGGGCVTAAGNPCVTTVPSGVGVSVLKGDSSRDTVTVDVLGTPISRDLGDCVGYNAGPGC